jgi:hypothetical protein
VVLIQVLPSERRERGNSWDVEVLFEDGFE